MKKPFLNRIEMPIRWVDLDAYQHLNNARFFDCMTEARAQLFKTLKTTAMPCYLVVVDTHCNFKKSYHYPDTIIIDLYLGEIGRASFMLHYEFKSLNDAGILYAEGHTKIVSYDPVKNKAIGIPESVLTILLSHMNS